MKLLLMSRLAVYILVLDIPIWPGHSTDLWLELNVVNRSAISFLPYCDMIV